MGEIFRTRDLVVLTKGVTYTPAASPQMLQSGWPGGQGVLWMDSDTNQFQVDFGDGVRGAGFALWGSDEDSDQLTSITGYQVTSGHLVIGAGSWILMTRTFERYTYASRISPPLVPISYTEGEHLLWSLRGLFTNEDEWSITGDPRAPNGNFVGNVVKAPSTLTNNFMTVQTTL